MKGEYKIRIANSKDAPRWKEFTSRIPDIHPSYDWNWRTIFEKVFKYSPYYLLAVDKESNVHGILPIFYVKSFLFGSALISVPHLNGGGPILSPLLSTEDEQKIWTLFLTYTLSIAGEKSASYTELRCRDQFSNIPQVSELEMKCHKVSMKLPLSEDPELLFSTFPPKLRSQIRKPTKEGCSSISVKGNEANEQQISDFYDVFSENMRSLGTPVYPKELFSQTLKIFGANSRLALVYSGKQVLAGGICVSTGSSVVEIPWAASLRQYSKLAPNMLLYWTLLKDSCIDGYQFFDFGRSSKGAGTYKFKEQWGAKPQPLYWYYQLLNGEVPNISPENKKFSTLIKVWKKLPLPVTKILGSYITRGLP